MLGGKSVEIKDSGRRRTFETGAVRDVAEGKGRCDIMNVIVEGVPDVEKRHDVAPTFTLGAVRDVAEGKGRCDIMPLFDIGNTLDDNILRLIGLYVEHGNISNLESAVKLFVESELTENPIIFPFLIYDVLLDLSKFYEKG